MTKSRPAGVLLVLALLAVSWGQEQKTRSASTSSMTSVNPDATFVVGGDPDWMAVSEDAVWVTSSKLNLVTELRAASNVIGRRIPVADPCSGLVAAFGSLWIPSCGNHELVRADLKTAKVQARIPLAPADPEGCIAAGAGSIWIASSAAGVLSRIDPRSNSVVGSISVPSGSFCPYSATGLCGSHRPPIAYSPKWIPPATVLLRRHSWERIPGSPPPVPVPFGHSIGGWNHLPRGDEIRETHLQYSRRPCWPWRRDNLRARLRMGNHDWYSTYARRGKKQLSGASVERQWRGQRSGRSWLNLVG